MSLGAGDNQYVESETSPLAPNHFEGGVRIDHAAISEHEPHVSRHEIQPQTSFRPEPECVSRTFIEESDRSCEFAPPLARLQSWIPNRPSISGSPG